MDRPRILQVLHEPLQRGGNPDDRVGRPGLVRCAAERAICQWHRRHTPQLHGMHRRVWHEGRFVPVPSRAPSFSVVRTPEVLGCCLACVLFFSSSLLQWHSAMNRGANKTERNKEIVTSQCRPCSLPQLPLCRRPGERTWSFLLDGATKVVDFDCSSPFGLFF